MSSNVAFKRITQVAIPDTMKIVDLPAQVEGLQKDVLGKVTSLECVRWGVNMTDKIDEGVVPDKEIVMYSRQEYKHGYDNVPQKVALCVPSVSIMPSNPSTIPNRPIFFSYAGCPTNFMFSDGSTSTGFAGHFGLTVVAVKKTEDGQLLRCPWINSFEDYWKPEPEPVVVVPAVCHSESEEESEDSVPALEESDSESDDEPEPFVHNPEPESDSDSDDDDDDNVDESEEEEAEEEEPIPEGLDDNIDGDVDPNSELPDTTPLLTAEQVAEMMAASEKIRTDKIKREKCVSIRYARKAREIATNVAALLTEASAEGRFHNFSHMEVIEGYRNSELTKAVKQILPGLNVAFNGCYLSISTAVCADPDAKTEA